MEYTNSGTVFGDERDVQPPDERDCEPTEILAERFGRQREFLVASIRAEIRELDDISMLVGQAQQVRLDIQSVVMRLEKAIVKMETLR